MREFTVTLNLLFEAHDEDEAAEIAKACAKAIEAYSPFRVIIEADKVEEA